MYSYRYMKVPKLNTSILKLYLKVHVHVHVHVLSSAYFKIIHVPGTLGTSSTWIAILLTRSTRSTLQVRGTAILLIRSTRSTRLFIPLQDLTRIGWMRRILRSYS